MTKEILIGAIPALLIFLSLIGINITPIFFLVAISGVLLLIAYSSGGLNSLMKKTNYNIPDSRISFEQVGGQTRAKRELTEALEFIVKADKYQKMGIRPLKGLLLIGPPGTGKTLLAKAAANYTNSAFLTANGSEFVEMYVGVGAKKIREIFDSAYKQAEQENKDSAIIFIDEIDVIGQRRDAGGIGNKEYDQTLNQLLTEMDGIKTHNSVRILVIAATNRYDLLDPALLRPGRFDRKVLVDLPDKQGREQILKIHVRSKSLADDVTVDYIVSKTFGFSGAELENLLNEASILALRDSSEQIRKKHIDEGIDKVLMGEKADRRPNAEELTRIAYHELGHAVVSETLNPGTVDRISITPRGGALGYVRQTDQQDRYIYTREMFEKYIMIALAGSVSEQIFLGNKSTGSENDFQKAMELTKKIIDSGLSELGIIDEQLNKEEIKQQTAQMLEHLEQKTFAIIEKEKQTIVNAYAILIDKESIDGCKFRDLLSS